MIPKIKPYLFLLIFLLFLYKGTIGIDPDFGWHLKTGEYILQNGIPQNDVFSYTMPSFPYVDHAWSIDLLIAKLYPSSGFIVLSFLFSLVALLYFFRIKTKSFEFAIVPFLFSVIVFFDFFTIRAQVFTWLFFGIVTTLILDRKMWEKYRFFVPLLFIIWANTHGGFLSGIAVLVIVFVCWFFQRKLTFKDVLVGILSVLLTLINPYGIRLWQEVYLTVSSIYLKASILEWSPFYKVPIFAPVWIFGLSFFLLFRYYKKLDRSLIALYFFWLIQAISNIKQIPLFVVPAYVISAQSLDFLNEEASRTKEGVSRLKTAYIVFVFLSIFVSSLTIIDSIERWSELREEIFYPQQAISFLQNNPQKGQLFTEYGWGGYLLWKLPGSKTFVDGRMAIWRGNMNPNEEENAYKTYIEMVNGEKDYNDVFDRYGITTVLWSKEQEEATLRSSLETNIARLYGQQTSSYRFIEDLEQDGWKRIYEDDLASIYTKE